MVDGQQQGGLRVRVRDLATALGNRKAGRAWMPRFKSKHRSRPTCRFTTGSFGLSADRRHIRLPVIGTIRTAESTRKLARKVEAGPLASVPPP